MFDQIVAFFMGAAANDALGSAEQRRVAAISRAEGRVSGILRVVDGQAAGLSRHWHGHAARPLAGAISFEFNRVEIERIRRRPEPISTRESFSTPIGTFELLELTTPTGTVEWAMLPDDVDWVIAKIEDRAVPPAAEL